MNFKIGLYLGVLLLLTSCEFFQPISPTPEAFYIKMFGGLGTQEGKVMAVLNENEIYLLGHSTSFSDDGLNQLYLIKVDKAGNEIWAKSIEGTSETFAVDMEISGNSLVLLSNTNTPNGEKIRIIKTDLQGSIEWESILNASNTIAYEAERLSIMDGTDNFFVVGTQKEPNINQIYAMEMNLSQIVKWEKTYSLIDRKAEFGVGITEFQGNVLIIGRSIGNNQIERPIIIEADRNSIGEELQSEILYQNNNLEANIIVKDVLKNNNNELVLLCQNNNDAAIIHLTVTSQDRIIPNSQKMISGTITPTSFSPTSTSDGLLIVGKYNNQLALLKSTLNGDALWTKTYGVANETNLGTQVIQQADGTILFTGTLHFFSNSMIGLIKTNENGDLK